MSERRRFAGLAVAGITFQGGSAAVDSTTIMSALIFQLTASPVAVGAVPAILRFGWLVPQLAVGFLVQTGQSSMRYFVIGAFGRATCMAALAVALAVGAEWPPFALGLAVIGLWTAYSFISGIVAVPYNDIVARSVASHRRSRLLATRFLGGSIFALAVAALADRFVGAYGFPRSYAALAATASALMFASSVIFMRSGRSGAGGTHNAKRDFPAFLRGGIRVFRTDRAFRRFAVAQWCGGAVLMAGPFFFV